MNGGRLPVNLGGSLVRAQLRRQPAKLCEPRSRAGAGLTGGIDEPGFREAGDIVRLLPPLQRRRTTAMLIPPALRSLWVGVSPLPTTEPR
jgi:hypothetical protein